MGLLQEWRDYAYKFDDRTQEGQQFWLSYFGIEKEIYVKLLSERLCRKRNRQRTGRKIRDGTSVFCRFSGRDQ